VQCSTVEQCSLVHFAPVSRRTATQAGVTGVKPTVMAFEIRANRVLLGMSGDFLQDG
jgi:hypothetical protein